MRSVYRFIREFIKAVDKKRNTIKTRIKYIQSMRSGGKNVQMSQSKANGNCSLLGKDDVRGQISENIFAPNRGYCVCSKKVCIAFLQIFFATRVGLKMGEYIKNRLHLAPKYARIFVSRNYLFREQFSSNCELLGTDNVKGQISGHISAPNGGYCIYYLSNLYCNTRASQNWGIYKQ